MKTNVLEIKQKANSKYKVTLENGSLHFNSLGQVVNYMIQKHKTY